MPTLIRKGTKHSIQNKISSIISVGANELLQCLKSKTTGILNILSVQGRAQSRTRTTKYVEVWIRLSNWNVWVRFAVMTIIMYSLTVSFSVQCQTLSNARKIYLLWLQSKRIWLYSKYRNFQKEKECLSYKSLEFN